MLLPHSRTPVCSVNSFTTFISEPDEFTLILLMSVNFEKGYILVAAYATDLLLPALAY